MRDHKEEDDEPIRLQVARTLKSQYNQKIESLANAASQVPEVMEDDQENSQIIEEDIEEDDIREDKKAWEPRDGIVEKTESISNNSLNKRPQEVTSEEDQEAINRSKQELKRIPDTTSTPVDQRIHASQGKT